MPAISFEFFPPKTDEQRTQLDHAAQVLKAHQPENSKLITFPLLGKRLDWVLISPGLEFSSYEVIGTDISDHRGVLAELTLSSG